VSLNFWLTAAMVAGVGALALWTTKVYEPRMKAKAASDARMFECIMARELIELNSSQEHREHMLSFILSRRPTMPAWPEWREVWGDDDPLNGERLLH
jgi:hypothetical protein